MCMEYEYCLCCFTSSVSWSYSSISLGNRASLPNCPLSPSWIGFIPSFIKSLGQKTCHLLSCLISSFRISRLAQLEGKSWLWSEGSWKVSEGGKSGWRVKLLYLLVSRLNRVSSFRINAVCADSSQENQMLQTDKSYKILFLKPRKSIGSPRVWSFLWFKDLPSPVLEDLRYL